MAEKSKGLFETQSLRPSKDSVTYPDWDSLPAQSVRFQANPARVVAPSGAGEVRPCGSRASL